MDSEWEYRFLVVVKSSGERSNVSMANDMLTQGWEPYRETSMGGSRDDCAALVLFRRRKGTA